ncbi:MAG: helicase C-terminal domain-containing protein [Neisseriaceae bacterium]
MLNVTNVYEDIINNMPDFKIRHSQLDMIRIIDDCFNNVNDTIKDGHNICLVEAPTGTGKSMAYLVAGVVNAKRLGKKFVITTATKTLQSQLFTKDIPNFIRHSKIDFSYNIAKGRSNYLCPYQLELSLSEAQPEIFYDSEKTQNTLHLIQKNFIDKKWDGDLDISPINIDNKIKPLITIDKDSCLNTLCPYNQKDQCNCPYFKKRNELKFSDVIVTNHNLLLSDLTLGGGVVLPVGPEHYVLCIDEGHNFADIAIDALTAHFGLKNSIITCNNLAKFIYNSETKTYIHGVNIPICDEVSELTLSLVSELDKLLVIFTKNIELFKDNQLILNDYIDPQMEIFRDHFVNCAFIAGELYSKLSKIQEKLKESIKENKDYLVENNLSKLGFYIGEVEKILSTSQYIINKDDSRYNANARWVELKPLKIDTEFVIYASLTHVGNLLFNLLFSRVYAASIVSATLAVGEDFKYYLYKLGLNLYKNVQTVKLPASFAYSKQAQIVVPRFNYSPEYSTRNQFTNELANYLTTKVLEYNDGYGTLVLFFNKSQLLETYNLLPKILQQNILLQTDYTSNQRLIDDHKKNIDKGQSSIIFGLNSFAEGVDLPSLYCIHVIITKLPFETHKNPLNTVQEYWFNFEKASYFMEVSLPDTCIKLIQAAGRLIRSDNDYGQLTICDNRIVTKGYGSILLNSLPSFNRKYNKNFIQESYTVIKTQI